MNKIAALAVSSMLLASVALAEVKEDCSAKLNGAVRCEFTNTGKKKDSACVVVEMVRLYNARGSRSSLPVIISARRTICERLKYSDCS